MTKQRDRNHLLRTYDDRSRAIEGERKWAVEMQRWRAKCREAELDADHLQNELFACQTDLNAARDCMAKNGVAFVTVK